MEGKRIISLMGRFVEETGADVDRFLYDGDVFGNYDVVLNYKGISLALNCDRGYLSVLVQALVSSATRSSTRKYLLARPPATNTILTAFAITRGWQKCCPSSA